MEGIVGWESVRLEEWRDGGRGGGGGVLVDRARVLVLE